MKNKMHINKFRMYLTGVFMLLFSGFLQAQDNFDALPTNRNWSSVESYDVNGAVRSRGVSFFDELGKVQQIQTKDILTNKIWVSQTLYDHQGRAALSTLGAPVGTTFGYRSSFMRNSSNGTYSLTDFETNPNNPSTVGTASNTLGNYYSTANDDSDYPGNSYMDITSYPFLRTIFSTLNPGTPLKAIGGNKVNGAWPQAYTFSMRAGQELAQSVAFGETKYAVSDYKILKTVSRDVHGNENVVFADSDGRALASARSGSSTSRSMSIDILDQGFVDIHVPQGSNMGFTVTTNGNAITVHNLITETIVTPSTSLSNGFYRVSVNDLDNYDSTNPVTVNYKENYYDYSLNEYDKAGRLIANYQSLGNSKATKPKTTYEYNTLGQLTYTKSPDEGENYFVYRDDGQIRFSGQLGSPPTYNTWISYSDYDAYGRPVESGQLYATITQMTPTMPSSNFSKREQVYTQYDDINSSELSGISGLNSAYHNPNFLSGNIAKSWNDYSTTYYNYDAYGRLTWLVQNISGLGVKTIDYEYDPITGLTTKVIYQKNVSNERFYHRYSYNNADQLIKVETSTNGSSYTTNAEYEYYEIGVLKRTELAGGSQGVDYVYNLAGQLKSINHPSLSGADDPGGDSNDLFGMQLDYHQDDYTRSQRANITTPSYGINQLNGNIKGIRWNNKVFQITGKQSAYAYSYDRNNWLTEADYGQFENGSQASQDNITSNSIYGSGSNTTLEANNSVILQPGFHAQSGSIFKVLIASGQNFNQVGNGDYDVTGITYDANGNIQTLIRNKDANGGNAMDDLTYTYKTDPQNGPNQLLRVDDAAGDVANADDIGDQNGNNYVYNQIGQLVENVQEGLKYYYNASNLVTEVRKNNLPVVKFYYNDRNHRVRKETFNNSGSAIGNTYYIKDVVGKTIAVYNNTTLLEQPIYGIGREGLYRRAGGIVTYEIKDHLGNVRAVFQKSGSNTTNENHNDYYPFGMPMPSRNSLDASIYRYAFQGQEKDPETGKEAFELRLWDSRIGRWLSADPYKQHVSPYLGMSNNPIVRIDADGGFDTWIGAFLYRLFNGGGGEIFENDSGQFGIDRTGVEGVEGVELIYGFDWERNLDGNFQLFNESDVTFAQFGADPAIATTLHSNLSLIIGKNKSIDRVNPSDYNFRVSLRTRSSDPRIGRSEGVISSSINIEFEDSSERRELLRLPPPNYAKGEAQLIDGSLFPSVMTSFRIKDSYNGRFKVSLHRLNWFYKGTEPGAHIGTKLGIPAGIDPLFGGLSFGGRVTLFGE